MPTTLLAVDDSNTMRKVLEITFSGEDFRVLVAEGRDAALAKLSENPQVILIDTVLGSEDGYALCKEIRHRAPQAALMLLASRYSPYDQAKGRDAGADDAVDKPFDTQQMIERVRKLVLSKGAAAPAVSAPIPAPPATAPLPVTAPSGGPRPAAPPVPARPAPPPPKPAMPVTPASRSHTLVFGADQPMQRPQVAPAAHHQEPAPGPVRRPTPTTVAPVRPEEHAAPAPPPREREAPAHAASTNGQFAGKLGELGLNAAQVEAVLALSREVVERVVWEVVPQLAEAIIKEEIARLTKEG